MNREEYREYLKSDGWRGYRRSQMERAGWTCQRCHIFPAEHLHHEHYRTVGRETPACTTPICPDCHSWLHGKSKFDPKLRYGWGGVEEMLRAIR
ncbi:MAG: hypothetical protein K2X87_32025 [Gemmataceae bacterium]|nr:hypothetical protein [Gemmataceae bacterium]